MPTAEQATEQTSFEQRFYEDLHHRELVSDLGRVGIQGYEKRFYDELTSGLAEALKSRGVIRTYYPFEVSEGKLVAEDGEQLTQLLERGRAKTFMMVRKDHLFYSQFLMQRANHEFNEHLDWELMATGVAGYNTMITFSPYSEEFAQTDEDQQKLVAAAQNPDLKRTMLRLAHWDGTQMHVITRSMDNASVELLKTAAWRQWSYKFQADDSTSMLGERLSWQIDDESWQTLLDDVTGAADAILQERDPKRTGYKQGRPIGEDQDLQKFVESETSIVQKLTQAAKQLAQRCSSFEGWQKAFHNEAYNYVALLENRLAGGITELIGDIEHAAEFAGAMARADGRSYDMCGTLLSPDGGDSLAYQIGFEVVARLAISEFDSTFCPNCLPKKEPGKKVRAYKQGDRLGCKNCGHEVDVCTKQVYKQGRNTAA